MCEYIACQGPLSTTLADFWQMIWEQGVLHIVMTTSLESEGKVCLLEFCIRDCLFEIDCFLKFGRKSVHSTGQILKNLFCLVMLL